MVWKQKRAISLAWPRWQTLCTMAHSQETPLFFRRTGEVHSANLQRYRGILTQCPNTGGKLHSSATQWDCSWHNCSFLFMRTFKPTLMHLSIKPVMSLWGLMGVIMGIPFVLSERQFECYRGQIPFVSTSRSVGIEFVLNKWATPTFTFTRDIVATYSCVTIAISSLIWYARLRHAAYGFKPFVITICNLLVYVPWCIDNAFSHPKLFGINLTERPPEGVQAIVTHGP